MIHEITLPGDKRQHFRDALASGKLIRCPGATSPLVAKLIERKGFGAVYISGAVVSAELALPDIGLTSVTEVAERGAAISRATNLPSIIDADTGFGEPVNASRTISLLEEAGVSACHIEDQVSIKRCGHLDNKVLVSTDTMAQRIKAARLGRRDPAFTIIARTDARNIEGLDAAINRAKAYVDAGADMIFPESLQTLQEFEAFRSALSVPLMANMTEFGKSPLLSTQELEELGYNMVIYPVTALRLAMKAIETGLDHLLSHGHQSGLIPAMQTREELYALLDYDDYGLFDENIANFRPGNEASQHLSPSKRKKS